MTKLATKARNERRRTVSRNTVKALDAIQTANLFAHTRVILLHEIFSMLHVTNRATSGSACGPCGGRVAAFEAHLGAAGGHHGGAGAR
jgi:hypothetical protein